MGQVILSLESFGNGEGPNVGVAVTITADRLADLLAKADAFRAVADAGLLRMVWFDAGPTAYYQNEQDDDAIDDAIMDFVDDADGIQVIDELPGEPNCRVDGRTVQVMLGGDGKLEFMWRASARHTNDVFSTVKVGEDYLRGLVV